MPLHARLDLLEARLETVQACVGGLRSDLLAIRGYLVRAVEGDRPGASEGGVGAGDKGAGEGDPGSGEETGGKAGTQEAEKAERDRIFAKFYDRKTDEVTGAGEAALETAWMTDGL